MDFALLSLIAASGVFVGSHFALSHPLRAPLAGAIGEGPFLALYSLVALAAFVWMIFAFRAAPAPDLPGTGAAGWMLASLLTIPALVLFLGSLRGNPALPDPSRKNAFPQKPSGVFAATRHPMMWSFALWAIAHLLLYWSWRTMIVAFTIGFLALVGARMQDRKKARMPGNNWAVWESTTSYWLRPGKLFEVGWRLWLLAMLVWLALTYAHIHAAGVPAGIWRWL